MGFIAGTPKFWWLACDGCGHLLVRHGCSGMTEQEFCEQNATMFFGTMEQLDATARDHAWSLEQGLWRCSCCVADAECDDPPMAWIHP